MAPERTNKAASPRRISALIRDKKKMILTAGLVAVMGIMWIRVLTGRKPQAAAAAMVTPSASKAAAKSDPPVKLRFLDLPVVPGRNDTIDRDFFIVRDWSNFAKGSDSSTASTDAEGVRSSGDRMNEGLNRVTQKLKLQAVLLTENPLAYINDRLLHVGETLALKDGADLYVFEVKRIGEEAVWVECEGKQVTLKMEQPKDVAN